MKKYWCLFLLLSLLPSGLKAELPVNDALADLLFHQLLLAEITDDYDSFVANGTIEFKAGLSKTQFEIAADSMKNRLKNGYDADPLGELNQRGYQVYLFRIRFKDGGDDMLGTLNVKGDKIAGIWFK